MLRLCRLVMNEYYGLSEKVLIESPFAEVTEDGEGLRQVQLALTRKYILIGEDRFDQEATETLTNVHPKPDIEPEIESMQLIEVIPLKVIRIKIYRRGKRETLKIIAGNYAKIMYFEFGGHLLKRMYWIIWKDRIENMKIAINKYSKFPKYTDPYSEPETPLTSNSEYEVPKRFHVFADIHNDIGKQKVGYQPKEIRDSSTTTYCDIESKSPFQEKIHMIHRYFVDALTNSKLRILDKKSAYNTIKTATEHDYIIDLSHAKYNGGCTLNRESVSIGVIRTSQ